MPTLKEKVVINAPIDDVFRRLAEPERAPEWTPNLVKVERTSDTEAGPGLETAIVAKVGGRDSHGTGRCISWEPPRQLVLESNLDVGVTSKTTFLLAERNGATELQAQVDYTLPPKGFGKLVGGLLGDTLARRDLRKALTTLKGQLEAQR